MEQQILVKETGHIRIIEIPVNDQEDFFDLVEQLGIHWALDEEKPSRANYLRIRLWGDLADIVAVCLHSQTLLIKGKETRFELVVPQGWYYDFEQFLVSKLELAEPANFAFAMVDDKPARAWLSLPPEDEQRLRSEAERFTTLKKIPAE